MDAKSTFFKAVRKQLKNQLAILAKWVGSGRNWRTTQVLLFLAAARDRDFAIARTAVAA